MPPCLALVLALVAFEVRFAQAQTLTTALLRPVRDGFVSPQESPLRRTSEQTGDVTSGTTGDAANDARLRDKDTPAPSRIGNIPTYGLPAASGASTGQAETAAGSRQPCAGGFDGAVVGPAIRDRQQDPDPARDGRHGGRPAAAQAVEDR